MWQHQGRRRPGLLADEEEIQVQGTRTAGKVSRAAVLGF
jgi:hypothetical protein